MGEWDLPTDVATDSSIERVGGGGFFWESGVYDATIKLAYLNQNPTTKSVSINIILKNSNGKELSETLFIKSGTEKGSKTYYTTKDGTKRPLPGYAVADSLCIAAGQGSLSKCIDAAEQKTVNIYDYDARKELPVQRPVLITLLNKAIKVAVHQVKEDKTVKNEANQYVPTGDSRTKNECKFFGNSEGKTAEEITKGKEATMFTAWAEKNTGIVLDKTTKNAGKPSAADIMGGGNKTEANSAASLFTN